MAPPLLLSWPFILSLAFKIWYFFMIYPIPVLSWLCSFSLSDCLRLITTTKTGILLEFLILKFNRAWLCTRSCPFRISCWACPKLASSSRLPNPLLLLCSLSLEGAPRTYRHTSLCSTHEVPLLSKPSHSVSTKLCHCFMMKCVYSFLRLS